MKNNRINKNKSKAKQAAASIAIVVIAIIVGLGGYVYYQYNKLSTNISKNRADLGIEDSTVEELKKIQEEGSVDTDNIINIALFGIDSRDVKNDDGSRSDSIIILSIDKVHNKIKMASVLRDTYAQIDGHGNDKITHAYAFGGPQLAIKTLNKNFGLNIMNFVTVDFFGLEKIIDAIGGVKLDVKKTEIDEINKYIGQAAWLENKKPTPIKNAGTQVLNGMQAVAFGRIRHVGNGDYERTDRQREVLQAMFAKLQTLGVTRYASLATQCSSYVKTSFSLKDIISTGLDILKTKNIKIEEKMFPTDTKSTMKDGVFYLVADMDKAKREIKEFIYEVSLQDTKK